MNQDEKQRCETIDELSERTRLKKSWWYSQTRQTGPGSCPRIRAGKYLLFIPSEVDNWLKSQGEA
jgi:predicted DNA-binding transcriptional regulator AlpA